MTHTPPPRRRPLVSALAAASAFVVVAVAVAIVVRPLHDDRAVIRFVRRHPSDSLIDVASGYSAAAGPITVAVLAAIGAIILAVRDRRPARPAALLAATWGALAVTAVAKHVVGRPRPPVGWQLDGPDTSPAFPSTHVAGLTALLLIVIVLVAVERRAVRALAVGSAWCAVVAMAGARVYLCMNWASDVVAGGLLGVAVALIAAWSVDRVALRRPARPVESIP